MKKLILGCAMMISGMIGHIGWLITITSLVEGGAWSGIHIEFSFDWIMSFLFLILAIVGFVIAIKAIREDKSNN